MLSAMRTGLILGAVLLMVPNVGESCHRCKRTAKHCGTCQLPMPTCTCPPPAPVLLPQVSMQPVYETRYRKEQVVTHRNVVETHFRNEAYTESVPVTAVRNVCVDEGSYQQVWVPKIVTKQVAETVMQQRQACRAVPYQVTRTIPEVTSRMVPYQAVKYVPTCTPTPVCPPGSAQFPATSAYPFPPAAPTTAAVPFSRTPYATHPQGVPAPYAQAPFGQTANAQTTVPSQFATRPNPVELQAPVSNPVPDPYFLDTPEPASRTSPTPTSMRSDRDERYGDFRAIPPRREVVDHDESADSRRLFVPAPSAATVWRTPRGTVTR